LGVRCTRMPRACPEPSRRGGRRPGAGAPKGNTNALQTGAYSRHAARGAIRLIHAIPTFLEYYRSLRAKTGPHALHQRRNLIDAAQHVLDTHPHLAHELEALIYASLMYRSNRNRRFPYILRDIKLPASDPDLPDLRLPSGRPDPFSRPLRRALKHTAWLTRNDPALAFLLTNHIAADLEPKLEFLARTTIKQSNAAGQNQRPPSAGGL
jgi:hypothetical protein